MSATRVNDSTMRQAVLSMALELSERTWKLGFTTGLGQEPQQRRAKTDRLDMKTSVKMLVRSER